MRYDTRTLPMPARCCKNPRATRRTVVVTCLLVAIVTGTATAQVRLADGSDRTAVRSWFVLLADSQFERPHPEITDCAALVRFAFREALRPHSTEWVRQMKLPGTPTFPEVRSAPRPGPHGWPLFRISGGSAPRYAEFADARTIVSLNTSPVGRDPGALEPGDLLFFSQPEQAQPDHLMVFVGRSPFEDDGADWIVYHTGPLDGGAGELRKVRLADLQRHPAPRWRPVSSNRRFIGIFRLSAWS